MLRVFFIVILGCAGSSPALAAGSPMAPAVASSPAEAAALESAAVEAYRGGRLEEALAKLRAAEPFTTDRARLRYNIARCLEELGRVGEAIEAFESVVAIEGASDADAARARIAVLQTRHFGRLSVSCSEEGVEVRLDSGRWRSCPDVVTRVAPGWHVVVGRVDDGRVVERSIEAIAGEVSRVYLALPPRVEVEAAGEAITASAPAGHAGKPTGGEPGASTALEDAVPLPSSRRWAPWLVTAAGAAALIGGGVALWQADDAFEDTATSMALYEAADGHTSPEAYAALRRQTTARRDDGRLWAATGYGLIAAGAAATLGGLIWVGLADDPVATAWVDGDGVAVTMGGEW